MQTLWKTIQQFLKNIKYQITIWPNNTTPKYKLKRCENIYSHNMYTSICSSAIHNSRKPSSVYTREEQINKMWYYPYNGIVFSVIKRRQCWYMDESWKYDAKWKSRHKRPHVVWCHLHDMSRIGKSSIEVD